MQSMSDMNAKSRQNVAARITQITQMFSRYGRANLYASSTYFVSCGNSAQSNRDYSGLKIMSLDALGLDISAIVSSIFFRDILGRFVQTSRVAPKPGGEGEKDCRNPH